LEEERLKIPIARNGSFQPFWLQLCSSSAVERLSTSASSRPPQLHLTQQRLQPTSHLRKRFLKTKQLIQRKQWKARPRRKLQRRSTARLREKQCRKKHVLPPGIPKPLRRRQSIHRQKCTHRQKNRKLRLLLHHAEGSATVEKEESPSHRTTPPAAEPSHPSSPPHTPPPKVQQSPKHTTPPPAHQPRRRSTVSRRPEPSGVYLVQVYATPSLEDAKRWMERLRKLGISSVMVQTYEIGNQLWYRVRFGPFSSRKAAEQAAKKYHFAQVWIVRVR